MWTWVAVGWCAVAVGLAVLHHRLRPRQPLHAEVVRFLERLEQELLRLDDVQFLGMLPGRFACLLCVGGQETPLSLHELYRHHERFPGGFPLAVDQLVDELRNAALDRIDDHPFGAAATSILPQVRSRAWVEAQGTFGDAALVQRPLGQDLAVVYVIDDEHTMVFVCRGHLRQWGRSEQDLHQLALANLRRRGGLAALRELASREDLLLQTGDGYDAARVLLLEQQEGLLVALPDRDTLWVGREPERADSRGLVQLMAAAAAMAQRAPHPVSERLYRLRDGKLEPVADRN